jgi:hypothetical protein
VAAVAACVDPDGRYALLLGQRPALLDHDGRQYPVTDLDRAGTCARAASGGILAQLSSHTDGVRSQLRVLRADGTTTAHRELSGLVSVTAEPTSARVAYTGLGELREVDAATGAELRAVTGVAAARYDGAGGLVIVRSDRSLTWLDTG